MSDWNGTGRITRGDEMALIDDLNLLESCFAESGQTGFACKIKEAIEEISKLRAAIREHKEKFFQWWGPEMGEGQANAWDRKLWEAMQ